jgi:glycosyltransferase involved in cell wall biosynthesis
MKNMLTIITPVFNSVNLLRPTLESIQAQTCKNIEYIIIDGGSTDGTLELIKEYDQIVTTVISEPDFGMYDALSKGLKIAKGGVVCYLNSGDIFYNKTAEVVLNVFSENNINWMTGYRSLCNKRGVITRVEEPFRYKSNLIQQGVYGKWLPYIQQESTFWRCELNQFVNLNYLKNLKLAGDHYIWHCFSKHASLEIIKTPLGIFKVHDSQLSEDLTNYWGEVKLFSSSKNLLTFFEIFFESFFWMLDSKIREKLANNIWRFDHKKDRWTRGKVS